MRKLTKHDLHYIPLFLVMILGFSGFVYFKYEPLMQAAIVVSAAISYVVWGVLHHLTHKDLYLEVFLEYLIIAILCTVAALSVIFRV